MGEHVQGAGNELDTYKRGWPPLCLQRQVPLERPAGLWPEAKDKAIGVDIFSRFGAGFRLRLRMCIAR